MLDVGCGTGTFACRLATRGISVVGVDPAAASLDVARAKPGARSVRWIHGDATTLPAMSVDMAAMTGNVAQVFVTDKAWAATLRGVAAALHPGGWLVFETRVPAQRVWESWTTEQTWTRTDIEGAGIVERWHEIEDVSGQLVTFRAVNRFVRDGSDIESRSTLRFRERAEVEASLRAAGFTPREVRDAPDRAGLEYVFIAGT